MCKSIDNQQQVFSLVIGEQNQQKENKEKERSLVFCTTSEACDAHQIIPFIASLCFVFYSTIYGHCDDILKTGSFKKQNNQ